MISFSFGENLALTSAPKLPLKVRISLPVETSKIAGKKKVFRRSRIIQDAELLNDDLELSALIDQELNNFSIRGVDSPLTFASDNLSPEAYSIRGKYSIKDKMVYANISLFKGQKEKIYQFEISMSVGKEKELVSKIVENVQLFLRKS